MKFRFARTWSKDILDQKLDHGGVETPDRPVWKIPYDPFEYKRRSSDETSNIGARHVPVVVADFMHSKNISRQDLAAIGYLYDQVNDKWHLRDAAADLIYSGSQIIDFPLPGTLKVICNYNVWLSVEDKEKYFPLFQGKEYLMAGEISGQMNFLAIDTEDRRCICAPGAARQ